MAKTISGKRLMIRCRWVVKSKRSVAEALLRDVRRQVDVWECLVRGIVENRRGDRPQQTYETDAMGLD